MAADFVEIEAVVTELRRPPNCGDFFYGKARPSSAGSVGPMFPIIGTMPDDEAPSPGMNYMLYGKWKDGKFGRQLELMTLTPAKPHGRDGVILYLEKNAPHIGRARAVEAWNKLGPDALRVAREAPEVFAAKIGGMTQAKAEEVSAALRAMASLEGVNVQVLELLNGRGFPRQTAQKIIKKYGNRAVEVISRNPFKLDSIPGCGFLKCDAMWQSLGLPKDAMRRQVCAIMHAFRSEKEGHTWLHEADVNRFLKSKVAGAGLDFEQALKIAVRAKMLTVKRWCDTCSMTGKAMVRDLFDGETMVEATCHKCGGKGTHRLIAEKHKADAELRVATHLASASMEPSHWPKLVGVPEGEKGVTIHQACEGNKAMGGVIGLLTGSPGGGKTFLLAAIIKELLKTVHPGDIAIAGPTGKSAVRCSESLAKLGINLRATTIHSLLKVETADDGNWSFQHRENNPLPYRYIFIDEASMPPLPLIDSLLKARSRGTHILFVGDPNQLPPVEYGAPLRDMIAAGLPCGELREIKRNAGTIVRACAAIRDGKTIPLDKEFDLSGDDPKNLVLRTTRPEDMVRVLQERIKHLTEEMGADPIWDIQIIVAVNKRSQVCRTRLNGYLQDMLNPHGATTPNTPFRKNDKIIILKNSMLDNIDDNSKVAVANGEFGKVLEVEDKRTVVNILAPSRRVEVSRIPVKSRPESANDDESQSEESSTGCDMDLAFACTCHKLQGSSAKHVIVMLDPYPGATGKFGICDRSWIFTAISRAELTCDLIGTQATLKAQVAETKIWRRKTTLAQTIVRLQKEFAKVPEKILGSSTQFIELQGERKCHRKNSDFPCVLPPSQLNS